MHKVFGCECHNSIEDSKSADSHVQHSQYSHVLQQRRFAQQKLCQNSCTKSRPAPPPSHPHGGTGEGTLTLRSASLPGMNTRKHTLERSLYGVGTNYARVGIPQVDTLYMKLWVGLVVNLTRPLTWCFASGLRLVYGLDNGAPTENHPPERSLFNPRTKYALVGGFFSCRGLPFPAGAFIFLLGLLSSTAGPSFRSDL